MTKASGDNGLNYGDFSKYGVVSFSGVNDSDHDWSILTNPKQSFVTTSYMAGVVLCDVLRKLSKEDRAIFAKEYPVVFLAFNDDGTRKTLLELEKDRDQKLKNLSNIKDKKQQGLEKTAVVSLYETIIESDAVLSLERCLNHLTNLSWESERYFVPKNEDNKYSPTSIREEMKLVSEKAKAIVSIIEGDGAEFVEPILRVFEKTILDYTKDKKMDQTFLDDKKHYMFSITNLYFKNDDLALAPRDKVLKSDDKRKEIDRAVKTLKIVFPSLLPNPTVFGVSKEGKYIELPNIDERIMLDIAWEGYRAAYITKKDDDPDLLGVEPIDLQRAIRLVYPYNEYSIEDRLVVEEKIKNGEILLTPNLYEIVTEEDFYGDSEDEEMIVDTDDELDYNRFFVVKDDKKEETLQSETTKEDKKVEETEVVDDKEEQKEEVLTEKNISKEDQKPIKTVENKEEKPQEEAQKTAKAKEKQNKSLEKLAKNVGKVIDIKTQNAISSIEEVVIKKEKEKEEKEKLAKVKPLKEGKDVKQQFAEFEKVLEDIEKPAEIVEQKQPETVNKEEKAEAESIAVEEKSENKDEISIENIEEKDLKETENTESEDEKPEEKLIEESEKESKNESNEENLSEKDNKKEDIVDQQIDGLIEEVDKLIEETDKSSDDDDADLGKKEDNVDDVVVEKEEDKSETEEKPKEEKSKEITEKPKVNTIKEELEDGDKLTGEELLQKYFQYKEEQERIEAEKERLRAEAAARGEPYEEGEEVKIPVEPTKEDVYNSAIEIEDVDPNKKKKDD